MMSLQCAHSMIFGKVFARLSRKLRFAYNNKTCVKILEKKCPFSMIIIALKKEQMMFEALLPLQIDLAFGLEMWPENIDPKTYSFVTCVA